MIDVLVIGGGNAALCAALTARQAGASVLMLESAPRDWRAGNSPHTRNIRCMHVAPEDVLTDAYLEEEYWEDLNRVTKGITDERLARLVIRESASCRHWMKGQGVRFQPSLGGTLHLSRTNAFFLGGGKALVNAYCRSAEKHGIEIRYDSPVVDLETDGNGITRVWVGNSDDDETGRALSVREGAECLSARAVVVASGGFESNRTWLREAWGEAADNFLIRGSRFNRGTVLRRLIEAGAQPIGDATQGHCVAIDARAPSFDGGIVTRIDCVSLGIVVNVNGERFYDEGEDFWPKRYAIWGRLVALQPEQLAWSVIDSQAQGRFMPPVFPGLKANTLAELAVQMKIPVESFLITVQTFNDSVRPGHFDHSVLDDCVTEGLTPAKTHWALRIEKPPFIAYPLRPGLTFTYLGVKVNERAQVMLRQANGGFAPASRLFAAGEIMAGNVLGQGYLAGIGMTIGTVFGRIAGREAAACALLRPTETMEH